MAHSERIYFAKRRLAERYIMPGFKRPLAVCKLQLQTVQHLHACMCCNVHSQADTFSLFQCSPQQAGSKPLFSVCVLHAAYIIALIINRWLGHASVSSNCCAYAVWKGWLLCQEGVIPCVPSPRYLCQESDC